MSVPQDDRRNVDGPYEPVGELIEQHDHDNSASKRMAVCPEIPPSNSATPANDRPLNGVTHGVKRKSSSSHRSPGSDLTRQRLAALDEQLRVLTRHVDLAHAESRDDNSPNANQDLVPMDDDDGEDDDDEPEDAAQSVTEQQRPPLERNDTERRTVVGASDQEPSLPERMVFPIQVGTELFRFSGASISSDAPSYFSRFFEDQINQGVAPSEVRTLYIDRDPVIFRDISLHLQGYHIEPRDSVHYTRLFADAHWFGLPRLKAQLETSPIFVRVGDEEVQMSRDLFKGPGNSPNYFTLGFSVFFTHPTDVFPGLRTSSLLRPPPIAPPKVEGRSARVLREIIDALKGYPVHIRDEHHRDELLRDVRYYNFRGLEQQLIRHDISFNSFYRHRHEITIRLDDVRPEGLCQRPAIGTDQQLDPSSSDSAGEEEHRSVRRSEPSHIKLLNNSWVVYKRPFVDEDPIDLVIATDEEVLCYHVGESYGTTSHVKFSGKSAARLHSLLSPFGELTQLSQLREHNKVKNFSIDIRLEKSTDVILDGFKWQYVRNIPAPLHDATQWAIHKGLWRIKLEFLQDKFSERICRPVLYPLKLLASSSQRASNTRRVFL
ncbi:hypothetical protein MBLNU457_1474t1 [Dothideomycetes sp. NU457]